MLSQRLWDAIKDIGAVLWPARFSIGVLIISVPFLFLLGPSQDALLAAVGQHHSLWSKLLLAGVCLLWALETFYWAYFMSRLPAPPKGERAHPHDPLLAPEQLETLNNAFPFWLGLAALAIASGATFKANDGNPASEWSIAGASLVDAVFYVIFTRRFGADRLTPLIRFLLIVPRVNRVAPLAILRAARGHHHHRDLFALPPAPTAAAPVRRTVTSRSLPCRIALAVMVAVTVAVYLHYGAADPATRQWMAALVSLAWLIVGGGCVLLLRTQDMRPLTKFWVLCNFALFTGTFIASLYAAAFLNGGFPNVVSSPFVMLTAFCAWVFFGSFFFALPAELFRLPVTALILTFTLLLSCLPGDNHDIRLRDGAPPDPVSLSAALGHWYRQWDEATLKRWGDKGPPLVIIATAGGASRAGYWTTKVLGELEAAYPDFHHHVFAISSVSGGTVGAGLWRAMLQNPLCQRQSQPGTGGTYVNCARLFFCQDFLGPMFLAGLYADLTQRILPGRLLPDRAAALEQSWEEAWANMMRDPDAKNLAPTAGNPMRAPFHDLKPGDKDWRPLLLANGTSEKTGRRIITSQLKIEGDKFPDAIDFFHEIKTEMNLSTALHNSARFTYLDAAGNIVLASTDPRASKDTGVRPDRILDGGYFENFGAATAFDLLQALRAPEFAGNKFRPIIIQISADPTLETDDNRDPDWRRPLAAWPPDPILTVAADTLAPLVTLFNTRNAHGVRAMKLTQDSENVPYAHFRLTNTSIPMSWAMSGLIIKMIDDQWREPKATQDANNTLTGIFGPPANALSPTPDPPCGGL
jgi:hypothetical protein